MAERYAPTGWSEGVARQVREIAAKAGLHRDGWISAIDWSHFCRDSRAQSNHILKRAMEHGSLERAHMAVRRLTPVECERLQGFPDDWTAGLTDSARYRTLGNAVCVPVAEWIARRMRGADE